MSTPENTEVEEVITEPTELETATEQPEAVVEAEPVVEPEPEALSEVAEVEEVPEVSELQNAVAEFGAEVATEAFGNGGGYAEAKDLYFAGLKAENEKLKSERASGTDPIPLGEGEEAPVKIWKSL